MPRIPIVSTRPAASSMASGMPPDSRQTLITAGAFSAVSSKVRSKERARSENSRTES